MAIVQQHEINMTLKTHFMDGQTVDGHKQCSHHGTPPESCALRTSRAYQEMELSTEPFTQRSDPTVSPPTVRSPLLHTFRLDTELNFFGLLPCLRFACCLMPCPSSFFGSCHAPSWRTRARLKTPLCNGRGIHICRWYMHGKPLLCRFPHFDHH